jgi:hypothetical protein
MKTSLAVRSLNYLTALRDKPIRSGDTIDHDTLWCIALGAPEKKDIKELFATNNGMPASYFTYAYCEECEDIGYRHANKSQVLAFLENVNANYDCIPYEYEKRPYIKVQSCFKCLDDVRYKKQEKKKKEDEEYKARLIKKKKEDDDLMVSVYLNPEYVLPENANMRDLAMRMDRSITSFNSHAIMKTIKVMNYKDFLKTLYWKICAYRARKKSGFRCAMCGSNEKLNVHHSTYDFHGREHTKDGLKSLTCVCQSCHAKHHDK